MPLVLQPLAEGDERAGADQPDHLAVERAVAIAGRQTARARAGSSARRRRRRARSSSPRARAPRSTAPPRPPTSASGAGSPATADSSAAVADQVRVAADRRGEVAVARRRQAGVAEVAVVVVGLLERAQHQAGQRPAAAAGRARTQSADQRRRLAHHLGRLLRGQVALGHRRRRHPERRQLVDQPLDRRRLGPLVDPVQRRDLALGQRNRATCSLAAIISCSISRWDSVCSDQLGADHVAVAVEAELGLGASRAPRAGARRAPQRAQRRRRRARRRQRLAPRLGRALGARRRSGRPGRSRAARRSGSASGRSTALRTRAPGHRHLDGDRRARSSPGHQRAGARWTAAAAASARPRRARRRWSRGGRPRGRRASAAARRRRRRRCGPTPATPPSSSASAEIASSKSRAVTGSIVNVGSSRRSRAPAERVARRRASAACAPRARPRGQSAPRSPRSSISAPITSRATSGRPSRRAHAWPGATRRGGRCPARRRPDSTTRSPTVARLVAADHQPRPGLEERLGDEELALPREHRDPRRRGAGPRPSRTAASLRSSAATVRSATCSAVSVLASGFVDGVHVGLDARRPRLHAAAARGCGRWA